MALSPRSQVGGDVRDPGWTSEDVLDKPIQFYLNRH